MVFALLSKPHTVAMGGAVYILNGCKFKAGKVIEKKMSYNPVSALQVCEYLRSFLFSRSGLNPFGGALCYSGAFTLFEKQVVEDIGGFDRDNVAQDFEIIAHLQAYRYDKHYPLHLGFTTSAVAWTDVPSTFKQLWIQRIHWQEGSIRSMFLHIKMLFNPKYRMIGLFTYPYYFFGELFGSLIEFLAYVLVFVNWYLGILNLRWAVLMILVSWGFVAFLTMANTLISLVTYNKYRRLRDVLWIFFMVFLEQFGLRQYLVICRVFATIKYFLGL
jgi:cellulose synthase/poly-beta-1,6-N-acetylglucosamine synthase-like glycosyltransferase